MSTMSDTYRLLRLRDIWYRRRRVPDHLKAAFGRKDFYPDLAGEQVGS